MHRLIVSDLDGTLLPHAVREISCAVQSAIEEAVRNGADFCVCSGRSYADLKRLFRNFSVPVYYIACDGALSLYNEEIFFSHPIEAALPKEIDTFNVLAYSDYTVFASSQSLPFYRAAMKNHNGHVLPLSDAADNPIYKLALLNAPLQRFSNLSKVCRKNGWQEYVAKGVDKGAAVKKLQKILQYNTEETIILGDGENDISMAPCGKSYLIGSGFFGCEKHFSHCAPNFLTALTNELK